MCGMTEWESRRGGGDARPDVEQWPIVRHQMRGGARYGGQTGTAAGARRLLHSISLRVPFGGAADQVTLPWTGGLACVR